VGTALVLQSGLLRTAPTATLTLPDGATLSGEAPSRYVQGNLRITRAAGSGVSLLAMAPPSTARGWAPSPSRAPPACSPMT
jgi:hypothetical protein